MKNNITDRTTTESAHSIFEFMTIFGISLLFAFAGMQFLETKMEAISAQPEMEKATPATPDLIDVANASLDKLSDLVKVGF